MVWVALEITAMFVPFILFPEASAPLQAGTAILCLVIVYTMAGVYYTARDGNRHSR